MLCPHLPFSNTVHWVYFETGGSMKGYVSIVLEWEMHILHFIGNSAGRWGGGVAGWQPGHVQQCLGPAGAWTLFFIEMQEHDHCAGKVSARTLWVEIYKWIHEHRAWPSYKEMCMHVLQWWSAWADMGKKCIFISNSNEFYPGREVQGLHFAIYSEVNNLCIICQA